ncbi:hypothetical protein BH23ACT12_BH23ACT12_09850 [soil metagenome]
MVAPALPAKQNLGLLAINQTFKQLKEHTGTTFGAAAILCVPLAFIGVITALVPGVGSFLLKLVFGAIIGIWLAYATTVAVGLYSEGRDPGPGGLLRRSLTLGLVRFGFTSLLFNLVIGVVALAALIPFFMSLATVDFSSLLRFRPAEGDIVRIFLGFLLSMPLLLIALLFTYLRLGLAQTSSALEGTGPGASLGRSWQVTRGHMWEFFVLSLLSTLIAVAISFVVSGPAAMVSNRPAPPTGPESFTPDFFREQMLGSGLGPAEAVITGISAYLTAVLLTPFSAALLANFFLLVRNPPAPPDIRSARMVPLRQAEDEAPSPEAAPVGAASGEPDPIPPTAPGSPTVPKDPHQPPGPQTPA